MKSTEDILQNLLDAGCCPELARHIAELMLCGDDAQANLLLQQHRKCLLEGVHTYHKQIDCLDYLTYTLAKEKHEMG